MGKGAGRSFRVADSSLLHTTGLAALEAGRDKPKLELRFKELKPSSGSSVLADWVTALSHHDQRIIMSCFRGMDQGAGGAQAGEFTKTLIHAMRQACQSTGKKDWKVDAHYLGDTNAIELVKIKKVRREVEHVSNHYLDHLLNPLYLIARELGEPWQEWYTYLWTKLSFPEPDWHGPVEDAEPSAV